VLQVGQLIGDLIQAFGFHSALSGYVSSCCDYTRRRAGSDARNLRQFPMPTGITYDRTTLLAEAGRLRSSETFEEEDE
jgi:hypothetical protein